MKSVALNKKVWIQILTITILLLFAFLSLYFLIEKSSKNQILTPSVVIIKKSKPKPTEIKLGKPLPLPYREPQISSNSSKAPIVSKINTTQKVIFLTIDDGATKNAEMLSLLQASNIKASLFLDNNFIANNYDFFKPFVAAGMYIENHAVHHIYARPGAISYEKQRQEICGMADIIEKQYGRRPTLYRAPGGWIDDNTTSAAAACGMKAVVQWSAKVNGGTVQYQVGSSFRPGDIVLMHFRPEFKADLEAFVTAANSAGLTTDYLENWL